jgi:blue light- and temperature-responsive anti-repressor
MTCEDLGVDVIAEGVETIEEYRWLRQQGIRLFQGSLIAKPAFEHLEQSCVFLG